MDRRSWLWRRKSLEKSPSGETESSGSVSSHSERFSDDQPLNLNNQSPEVTSKAAPGDEKELNDTFKTVSEKLSEALQNIRAKEELVNQHAKVAEEAVSGWERAENEVLVLKKQNDGLTQKNSILEERISHLDGALKECFRQLRQAREEQEEKIYDAIAKKNKEWDMKKCELESEITKLRNQLQNADAVSRLEAAEKENSILKLKLVSKTDEVELLMTERDLSIHAAETASKQHLDSIKKLAKFEAECRQLKAAARKVVATTDFQSTTTSSVCVESFTDGQSDCGEIGSPFIDNKEVCDPELGCKLKRSVGKGLIVSSPGIDLMDDFLEMERLAALPETRAGGSMGESGLRDGMEALINRTGKLEDNLKKVTAEKLNLEIALKECELQLQSSGYQSEKMGVELADLRRQLTRAFKEKQDLEEEADLLKLKLKMATERIEKSEADFMQVQDQLEEANEAKKTIEVKLKDTDQNKEKAELQLKETELELEGLRSSIHSLETEMDREKHYSRELLSSIHSLKTEMEKERNYSRELRSSIHSLETEMEKERNYSKELQLSIHNLETEMEKERNYSKELQSSIRSLKTEMEKERNYSREAVAERDKLSSETSRMKVKNKCQRSAIIDEFRINQDKELAVAASRYAECQMTIASLSRQLKCLASLEDDVDEAEEV